jgi:hypothetical protein
LKRPSSRLRPYFIRQYIPAAHRFSAGGNAQRAEAQELLDEIEAERSKAAKRLLYNELRDTLKIQIKIQAPTQPD